MVLWKTEILIHRNAVLGSCSEENNQTTGMSEMHIFNKEGTLALTNHWEKPNACFVPL